MPSAIASPTVMRGFERAVRVLEDHLHPAAHGAAAPRAAARRSRCRRARRCPTSAPAAAGWCARRVRLAAARLAHEARASRRGRSRRTRRPPRAPAVAAAAGTPPRAVVLDQVAHLEQRRRHGLGLRRVEPAARRSWPGPAGRSARRLRALLHRAKPHRGAKRQPAGHASGGGTAPGIGVQASALRASSCGTEANRPCVYGCAGRREQLRRWARSRRSGPRTSPPRGPRGPPRRRGRG